jgi:hypothetical protein
MASKKPEKSQFYKWDNNGRQLLGCFPGIERYFVMYDEHCRKPSCPCFSTGIQGLLTVIPARSWPGSRGFSSQVRETTLDSRQELAGMTNIGGSLPFPRRYVRRKKDRRARACLTECAGSDLWNPHVHAVGCFQRASSGFFAFQNRKKASRGSPFTPRGDDGTSNYLEYFSNNPFAGRQIHPSASSPNQTADSGEDHDRQAAYAASSASNSSARQTPSSDSRPESR